jgi:hypothetical protein
VSGSPEQLGLPLTADAGAEFTEALGLVLAGGIRLTEWGKENGIPAALELSDEEWVSRRLSGQVLLSVPEKRRVVKKLTAPPHEGGLGLSKPAASALIGLSERQIQRYKNEGEPPVSPKPAPPGSDEPGGETPVSPEPEGWTVEPCAECGKPTRRRWLHDEDEFGGRLLCDDCAAALDQGTLAPPSAHVHVGANSGENEWYTPSHYVEAARAVLGDIDLDPASTAAANEVVQASVYYDAAKDGLAYEWYGRVWLNPPYAQPLCARFCAHLLRELEAERVRAACVLVNNATETEWFQALGRGATAVCFPNGRVKFWHPEREAAPLQGQAVLYFGEEAEVFRGHFEPFGLVLEADGA